ncbi:alcohol dehydrogenase [Paenibacillus zeisoli]|uniref:Alcohol dehydrogenase n=1 Tax=Paenibacillus zeisoli TaxID=2496267 RepID=A0A3S1DD00_9BACL|nr:medium chain dehydrogenase/reductase family protein [Paenibacillus zeisoli]RUT35492.1 alcohol dehydrogenase [Paenibacillus zeisoli]
MKNTKVVVNRYGGPEVLEIVNEPLRIPTRNEVRIKVSCSGVALADMMRREGLYPNSPEVPFTPGYEAVGVIDALGEDVTQFEIGQKAAVFFDGVGAYASYVYCKAEEAIPIPPGIEDAEAVTIILNYVTAYQMLHRIAKVQEGDRILIHGASGGVGTALMDLGRLAKLKMYGTASASKHMPLERFRARLIDYRKDDFVEVIRQEAPEGIDAVFDPIGGENWRRSFTTLGEHGRFVGYGYTSVFQQGSGEIWASEWSNLAEQQVTPAGNPACLYSITNLRHQHPDWFMEDVSELMNLLAAGEIAPMIYDRLPLSEAAKAHQLLAESAVIGKVVLIS